MNIWKFQRDLTSRLLAWSGFSVASGAIFAARQEPFWRGLGGQFIGWGLVDGAIGFFGQRSAEKRRQEAPDPADAALTARERGKLRRLLWINAVLDVFYVLGGLALARSKGREEPFWRGSGAGIIVQGGFLFFFDLFHAVGLGRGTAGDEGS